MNRKPLRIAVLASGAGTTLQAIIDACDDGTLDGRVVVVIGNNSGVRAKGRAEHWPTRGDHVAGCRGAAHCRDLYPVAELAECGCGGRAKRVAQRDAH